MNECGICKTIIEENEKYCPFCGYKVDIYRFYSDYDRQYKYDIAFDNGKEIGSTKNRLLKPLRLKNSIAYRHAMVSKRIDEEKKKIESIEIALKNINNKIVYNRIENAKQKIGNLVESLYLCKYNYEYIKYSIGINTIKNESDRRPDIYTEKSLEIQKAKYEEWKSKLIEEGNVANISSFFDEKDKDYYGLIEKIALLMVGRVLKKASIIKNNDLGYISIQESNDKEIENILYEIDRLNGELDL